jgi:hypothetical protein
METWSQQSLHKHMTVYSSDQSKIGHVAETYEDSFLVQKGFLFAKDSYIPYCEIQQVDAAAVHLKLTANDAQQREWSKRPDYEDHLGDPTQLFYDRGHEVRDPFDKE